jgi:Interferon-induced transmembrane protein
VTSFEESVFAGTSAQIVAAVLAAVGLWWRNRQKSRDMAATHHLMLKQISDEISVIAAWINAYRLVAPDEERGEGYSRARRDLERAYAKLAETRGFQRTAEPPAEPAEPPAPPATPPAPARPPAAPVSASRAAVSRSLGITIAAVLLSWPSGIVTIFYFVRFRNSLRRGDEAAARKYYSRLYIWFWISVTVFIISVVVVLVVIAAKNGQQSVYGPP